MEKNVLAPGLETGLKKNIKTGQLVHVVNIYGQVKYFQTQAAFYRFMRRSGFEYKSWEIEGGDIVASWEKRFFSQQEMALKQNFYNGLRNTDDRNLDQ
jgi:hypothetical protein